MGMGILQIRDAGEHCEELTIVRYRTIEDK